MLRCTGSIAAAVHDSPQLRDVATATTFWLSTGYNFSCMIASDTLFDSRGGFARTGYPMIADIESLRDVAMATNFGTTLAANGLTGDNDMRISYKGWFVFSQPCVCWSLFLDAALRRPELFQAGDCQVGN